MRIFVSDLTGTVGKAVRAALAEGEGEHVIVGTVAAGKPEPRGVAATAEVGSPEAEDLAFSSDAVIVTLDGALADAHAVVRAMRRDVGEAQKVVVGISSVQTWARCAKPPEDEKLSENNYKRRKPGPKYADYRSLESYIMNLNRDGVQSVVVATGILYGAGEDMLHTLVKEAWLCEVDALAVPAAKKGGENQLPMIHVADVGKIAAAFVEAPPEKKYVVAVDTAASTLTEVATAISASLGPGPVRVMEQAEADDALLTNPALADLQVDMAFDAEDCVVAGLGFEWTSQGGFVENVDAIMQEYIKTRNLQPVRVALLGPPASGKTTLGAALAKHYYIPHVTAGTALASVREAESELATEVNTAISESKDGRLPARLFCKAVRSVLETPKMRNRGYVLDGLPRTFAEAKYLFAEVGEEEEEEVKGGEEDEAITVVPTALPTAVIMLAGETELFSQRLRAIPQADVEGTHNTEDGFNRRTKTYAEGNSPEDPRATIVFFENHGSLDTLTLNVTAASTVGALTDAAIPYIETGGVPYNYHPTEAEVAAAEAAKAAQAQAEAAAKAQAEADRLAAERAERAEREEAERQRMAQIAKSEAELLEARSAPLRGYLMENVIPTLTKGLLEVTKVQPDNPVDFLAEFLFRHSPTSDGSEYEAKLKAASHK